MVYLDNHSTTPCDPAVIRAMSPYFGEAFANPSSTEHAAGRLASEAVDASRAQVAALIGGRSGEIVFTSGATESNNIAIFGLACASDSDRSRIVTTAVEHKAVLGPCEELSRRGMDVVALPVDGEGRVDVDAAEKAIDESTLLVSIQAANNELGTIQPVAEVARLAHEKGALVHCDAAQAVGKIDVDVEDWGVDLMSVSAHKLYGPKGVGALYVRGGPFSMPLRPLTFGGGQEHQLRSGTLNVPGIVGFGKACELCWRLASDESKRVSALRDHLESEILRRVEGARRNGPLEGRLPGSSSLTFPGIDAEPLLVNVPDLAISTGSACNAGALEPSHVLLAIGLTREDAYGTIRIGVGRFNNEKEIAKAADDIQRAWKRLSAMKEIVVE
jgi:cysteine desulfurase